MTKAAYKKAREELIVMLVCAALVAALLLYVIPTLIKVPAAALRDDSFTPRTFPYFLGVVMAICVAVGDIKSALAFAKARKEALQNGCLKETESKKTLHEIMASLMPWLVYGVVVLYGLGIGRVGFIIPTLLMIPVVLWLIGCRKWQYYLYVYLFAASMWAIFRYALHVQLP